jgi:integrase
MPKKALNTLSARTLWTLPIGRHADGGGLSLDVRANGRSWLLRYEWGKTESGGRKTVEAGLGPLGKPALESLKQAREKAQEARGYLAEKPPRNPLEVWEAKRKAAAMPTFGESADRYFDLMKAEWVERHLERVRAVFQNHCGSIADKPVDRISTEDVLSVVNAYAREAPTSATKLRGVIEEILNLAQDNGYIDREKKNPAARRKKDRRWPKAPKAKHHAAMPYADLPSFMGKLREKQWDEAGNPVVAALALEFVILSAGRSGEIRLATWNEIDLNKKLWTIPAERMKAGEPHIVTLTDRMIAILEVMETVRCSSFVFPGFRRGGALTNKCFERLLKRLGVEYVTHGFRSAFRSFARAETNTEYEIAELAIAHNTGTATAKVYLRDHPVAKHFALMTAWSAHLGERPDNVIPMPKAG